MGINRYTIGSLNKTLEQNDIMKFKEKVLEHLKNNNLSLGE